MKHIDRYLFMNDLRPIIDASVGNDYGSRIARNVEFFNAVIEDVEETSAWADEGYYNEDDIRLAIGRVILRYLDPLSI